MKRTLLLILFSVTLLWGQAGNTLVIMHTGDIHGQILPRPDGSGGMAAVATIIRRAKPDAILDAGDMFTGTMIADEYSGKPLIDIMNRLNYTAVALGNHEFDHGMEAFHSRAREAHFPILSANIRGLEDVHPYTILNIRGIRIGVIGLTVEDLATLSHPKNMKGLTIRKLVESLGEILPTVRQQSDFVILLTHLTQDEQLRVAKAFPEIKLIIAGHPHIPRTTQVGGTLIAEAANSTQFVGRLDIRLNGKVPEAITEQLIAVRDVAPDPEIEAVIKPYRESLAARSAERLGDATGDLRYSRTEESPLANLITDALRKETKSDIAIHNIGGIRAALREGPITYNDVFQSFPFENTVVQMTLSGAQIRKVLSRLVVAVSGVRVVWDARSSLKVTSLTLDDGTPLDDQHLYTVVTSDFLWAGGDGLVEFMDGRDVKDSGKLLRDFLAEYIRHNPLITPKLDGRVTIIH